MLTEQDKLVETLKEFERAGSKLFEGPDVDVFFGLQRILLAILELPTQGKIYLVDALDECDSGLSELISLMTDDRLAPLSRVKWLITSRDREDIERQLRLTNPCLKLSLEINSPRVSRAVESYIDTKVQELEQKTKYSQVKSLRKRLVSI